jgi:SAM-dependent methyltransferase
VRRILALLEPVRPRQGLVLELGCGTGLLTRELAAAGHRVIATDASPAMLDLARSYPPTAEDIRLLVLPSDPLPPADAVVSVGHVLNYLPDEHASSRRSPRADLYADLLTEAQAEQNWLEYRLADDNAREMMAPHFKTSACRLWNEPGLPRGQRSMGVGRSTGCSAS